MPTIPAVNDRVLPSRLLISGVPGAGKSHFVDELGDSHGFRVLRYDDDASAILPMVRLAVRGEREAAAALLGRRVVVEWGFMPNVEGPAAAAVINAGFEGWWFDAELCDALPAWRKRQPGVDERYFQLQAARITSHRHVIEQLFRGHIIRTLRGDQHLSSAQIIAAMKQRTKVVRGPVRDDSSTKSTLTRRDAAACMAFDLRYDDNVF
jgi:hypothetical protein